LPSVATLAGTSGQASSKEDVPHPIRPARLGKRAHPGLTPPVDAPGNGASRAHPAGGPRNLPHRPGNPRNARVRKPCSRRKSPPIPDQPGSAMTGLSRRRSRVRVPSLPLKVLQIFTSCCRLGAKRPPASFIPRSSRAGNSRSEPPEAGNPRRKDDRPHRRASSRSGMPMLRICSGFV
jgi:hypothetical protein